MLYAPMLLAQIEAFVTVAREGSLSRAAQQLFVTQPALTARVQGLEREVGASLFMRTSRGMRLSEAGHAFLPYAVRAIDTLADGRRQVDALERGGAGQLALGAAPAVSTYVLPLLLKRFAETHPRIEVSVKTGHSEEILAQVLAEHVDVGLVRALRHPQIESTLLYEDRLVLVVMPDHAFSAAKSIEMEALRHEQLILFDRTSSYYELTSALFRQAGITPVGVMELDNIEAAKKMIQQGFGIALLPRTAVASELAAGTLREVQIADAEPVRRQIVAIRRRDRSADAGAAASFIATVEAMRSELAKEPRRRAGASRRAKAPARRSRAPARAPRR
jgi:DNA-binding transcriptional LysR family regulator